MSEQHRAAMKKHYETELEKVRGEIAGIDESMRLARERERALLEIIGRFGEDKDGTPEVHTS